MTWPICRASQVRFFMSAGPVSATIGTSRQFRKMLMDAALKQKIIDVCDSKIAQKGSNVGLSFYAFFANKNDNPKLLMEAATWWILTHRLDHFEKATKIRALAQAAN